MVAMDRQPSCAGRDFVDSAEPRSLAGSAGEIAASLDVLAAAARLRGAERLAEHPALSTNRSITNGETWLCPTPMTDAGVEVLISVLALGLQQVGVRVLLGLARTQNYPVQPPSSIG